MVSNHVEAADCANAFYMAEEGHTSGKTNIFFKNMSVLSWMTEDKLNLEKCALPRTEKLFATLRLAGIKEQLLVSLKDRNLKVTFQGDLE